MAQNSADQFDSRKAYQAQEEQSPFVSLCNVILESCKLTLVSSSMTGERSNCYTLYTAIRP